MPAERSKTGREVFCCISLLSLGEALCGWESHFHPLLNITLTSSRLLKSEGSPCLWAVKKALSTDRSTDVKRPGTKPARSSSRLGKVRTRVSSETQERGHSPLPQSQKG